MLLTYVPKRIHFGSATFLMRMNFAVMDWVRTVYMTSVPKMCVCLNVMQNENSQRAYTSERMYIDIRRPDRRTPMKVLVKKSYKFVQQVWDSYMVKNMEDTRYTHHDHTHKRSST